MRDRPLSSMLIELSDADQAFLVTLPDWEGRVSGPVTHADTYEDAARNGEDVLQLLIEATLECGEILPQPRLFASSSAR